MPPVFIAVLIALQFLIYCAARALLWQFRIQAPAQRKTLYVLAYALCNGFTLAALILRHIAPAQLAGLMPDFAPHLGACRFYNCTHLHEPGCGVRAAVHDEGVDDGSASQAISPSRYRIYADLSAELDQQAWQARGKA